MFSLRQIRSVSVVISLLFLITFAFNNCKPVGESSGRLIASSEGSNGNNGINAGQLMFQNSLTPLMQNRCGSCHNEPRLVTGIPAPLSIYNYSLMKNLVSSGPKTNDNFLINKTMDILSHGGGNMCPGGVSSTPCHEIAEWILEEYPLLVDGYAGKVVSITSLGRVQGWAMDSKNQAAIVTIFLYDGPVDAGGTLITSLLANEAGPGEPNGHYFSYQLPNTYTDGTSRDLYIYVDSAIAGNEIPGMPYNYAAYSYSTDGRAFYEATVRRALRTCSGCHSLNYEGQFAALLAPTPFQGATATTNELIRKANGELNHGGGGRCGGNKNAGPCAAIRDWWQTEFQ